MAKPGEKVKVHGGLVLYDLGGTPAPAAAAVKTDGTVAAASSSLTTKPAGSQGINALPAVRKLASELKIDLAAVAGMRPVCEIQFDGFLPAVLDQVVCHMGRLRNRSRGRHTAPLVLRAPHGGLIHERAMLKLQAPVRRVGGWDIRMPLFRLEKYYIPDADRVVRAAKQILSY